MRSKYLKSIMTEIHFIFIFNSFGFKSNVLDSFISKTGVNLDE